MTAQYSDATTDPGSKSAAEVEREVRESRARVERTLDEIQGRLSPGQLFDQAVTYFRQSGGREFAQNFGESLKQNPMPVALVAVGLAWMMMSGRRSYDDDGYERSTYWDDEIAGGEPEEASVYSTGYEPLYGSSQDWSAEREPGGEDDDGPGAFDRARDAARRAKDTAEHVMHRTREAASGTLEGASTRAEALRRKARGGMASARRGVRGAGRYGRRAREGLVETFYEHPLVLGSIGVAVGAAIGAALPPTRTEDEWMGETRDRLKREAAEAGREQFAKARAAAGAAVGAAREEADRQGLTPEAAKAGAESMRGKVERVAQAAKEAATEQAEQEGPGPKRDVTT
jgi:ElaB/YqjD/DUF883 family membrane-anchored ribosome-binding protein